MAASTLLDRLGRPITQSRLSGPSRESGAYRGSISNYRARRTYSQNQESAERSVTQERAADLYANSAAARSTLDAIATNAVGTGLTPQPLIPHQRLGISENEAREVKEQMSWLWSEWCCQAHANGNMHYEDLQYAAILSLLRPGEILQLPVMLSETERLSLGRTFSFGIQPLSPRRLRTPSDRLSEPDIREGIHLSPSGRPLGYWLASPAASSLGGWGSQTSLDDAALTSDQFTYIQARLGHRPGLLHLFRPGEEEEQIRGVSALSAATKLYRNLDDAIDYELLAQVIAASFPVFIALDNPRQDLPPGYNPFGERGDTDTSTAPRYHQTVDAGQVYYGNPGEKPEVLESKRPSQNFVDFVELVQRGYGGAAGLSFESATHNFSKSNYSSIRAALNEDWKTYKIYRSLMARRICQPTYQMVMEEAYLRGLLRLPKHAPDFYAAQFYWCNAYWYGPARGFVDPVKEIQAQLMAIANRLTTRTQVWAENGGDFDEGMDQIEAEERRLAALAPAPATVNVGKTGALREQQNDVTQAENEE